MLMRACHSWIDAAANGRIRLSARNSRMVIHLDSGPRLARICPFCREPLYRSVAGHDALTGAGREHWVTARRVCDARHAPWRLLASTGSPAAPVSLTPEAGGGGSAADDHGYAEDGSLSVRAIMTSCVAFVCPDEPVRNVAALLVEHDVGAIPVVSLRRPVGILTDRDLATRVMSRRLDPDETRVRDVMSRRLAIVSESARDRDAARIMRRRSVRRVLVVNDDEELVGIVALADIALWCRKGLAARALHGVSVPNP